MTFARRIHSCFNSSWWLRLNLRCAASNHFLYGGQVLLQKALTWCVHLPVFRLAVVTDVPLLASPVAVTADAAAAAATAEVRRAAAAVAASASAATIAAPGVALSPPPPLVVHQEDTTCLQGAQCSHVDAHTCRRTSPP